MIQNPFPGGVISDTAFYCWPARAEIPTRPIRRTPNMTLVIRRRNVGKPLIVPMGYPIRRACKGRQFSRKRQTRLLLFGGRPKALRRNARRTRWKLKDNDLYRVPGRRSPSLRRDTSSMPLRLGDKTDPERFLAVAKDRFAVLVHGTNICGQVRML